MQIEEGEARIRREEGGVVGMGQRPPRPGQDPNAALHMGDVAASVMIRRGQAQVAEAARLRGEAERIGLEKAALIRRRDAYIIRVTDGL